MSDDPQARPAPEPTAREIAERRQAAEMHYDLETEIHTRTLSELGALCKFDIGSRVVASIDSYGDLEVTDCVFDEDDRHRFIRWLVARYPEALEERG